MSGSRSSASDITSLGRCKEGQTYRGIFFLIKQNYNFVGWIGCHGLKVLNVDVDLGQWDMSERIDIYIMQIHNETVLNQQNSRFQENSRRCGHLFPYDTHE